MKNHPLTPMWDSRIGKLMEGQSKYPCIELPKEILQKSEKEIQEYIEEKAEDMRNIIWFPIMRRIRTQRNWPGCSGI